MSFHTNALREQYLQYERLGNEELVLAERKNITPLFKQMITKKINRFQPENLTVIMYGPPRDGKSYTAISLLREIRGFLNRTYQETKEIKIFPNETEFISGAGSLEFQDCCLIDEKKNNQFGEGSYAENEKMRDIDEICAAKCVILFRLKPAEIYGSSAHVVLKTHGKDIVKKQNKLLVKVREMNGERWIGHILVSIEPVLCEDRKKDIVGSCYTCPKFRVVCEACGKKDQDEGICKSCQKQLPKSICQEYIAQYERRKLAQIDDVLEGAVQGREKVLLAIAKELVNHAEFKAMKSSQARKLLVKSLVNDPSFPAATNRNLTMDEITQIVAFAAAKIKEESDNK